MREKESPAEQRVKDTREEEGEKHDASFTAKMPASLSLLKDDKLKELVLGSEYLSGASVLPSLEAPVRRLRGRGRPRRRG